MSAAPDLRTRIAELEVSRNQWKNLWLATLAQHPGMEADAERRGAIAALRDLATDPKIRLAPVHRKAIRERAERMEAGQ